MSYYGLIYVIMVNRRIKGVSRIVKAFLFMLAGLAEIGGGYLIWLSLREGKPIYLGIVGGVALVLYGVIPTFQAFPNFGIVYARLYRPIPFLGLGS